MEGFQYVDIFATKGIEYIIVMFFLAGFIYFSRYLRYRAPAPEAAPVHPRSLVEYFRVPDGYLFHQGHTWFRREGRELVSVGLDDFAQRFLGRIDELNLPHAGSRVNQGEKGWTLTVDSRIIPMISPVDGEVVAVNDAALRNPGVVNEDPYGKGWLLKVHPSRLAPNKRNMLSGEMARQWISGVLHRLREETARTAARDDLALGTTYQDGGTPVRGIARALAGNRWEELAREYLLADGSA